MCQSTNYNISFNIKRPGFYGGTVKQEGGNETPPCDGPGLTGVRRIDLDVFNKARDAGPPPPSPPHVTPVARCYRAGPGQAASL